MAKRNGRELYLGVRLGCIQSSCLQGLVDHSRWYAGCGWIWDTEKNTKRIMDSLVRHGVAKRDNAGSIKGSDLYTITAKGLSWLEARRAAKHLIEKVEEKVEANVPRYDIWHGQNGKLFGSLTSAEVAAEIEQLLDDDQRNLTITLKATSVEASQVHYPGGRVTVRTEVEVPL